MKTTVLAAAAAILVLGGAALFFVNRPVRLPPPSGPYGVSSRVLHLPADRSALATPIAEIWYPTSPDRGLAAGREAAMPVLIYLPGWDGAAVEDLFLIHDLVSHGIVVTSLRYPTASEVAAGRRRGVALRVEVPGGLDFSSQQAFDRTRALGDEKVRSRARNVAAVLDQLTRLNEDRGSELFGRLDLDHLGAWGFSFGGAAAAQAAWQDRRIKAVANLDGWLFADAALQGVPCPYLVLGDGSPLPSAADLAASEPTRRYSAIFDMEDYRRQVAGLTRYGGFLVTIDGTDHVNFSDAATRSSFRGLTGAGAIDPARALVITAAYLREFFKSSWFGQPAPLLEHDPPAYPEVHVKVFGRSDAGS
ncbi:MAG: hypothetical protein JWO51_2375 [Rhodospirillales bacterium]|nr:hypothetical protein [Rhodospirillales bacterium]